MQALLYRDLEPSSTTCTQILLATGINRFAHINNTGLSEQGAGELGPYFLFCRAGRKADCFSLWIPSLHSQSSLLPRCVLPVWLVYLQCMFCRYECWAAPHVQVQSFCLRKSFSFRVSDAVGSLSCPCQQILCRKLVKSSCVHARNVNSFLMDRGLDHIGEGLFSELQ